MQQLLWGIDLGGTKIELAVLNANDHSVVIRKRTATEADQGYNRILENIKQLIDQTTEELGQNPKAIGFSLPGTLDPGTRKMKNCNTLCMNGQTMDQDLKKILGIPVRIANDANCFVLAETHYGVLKGRTDASVVFGVILGTGVGGGVVVNGQVISGKHGIGGEWGHIQLDPDGEDCYCGKNGCNETIFSGPALERYYKNISGESLNLREIMAQKDHNPYARQTLEHLTESFGRALSAVTNLLDPDVVVIGGGLSHIDEVFTDGKEKLKKYIFNNKKVETQFVKPLLGDSAGVFGAVELVRDIS